MVVLYFELQMQAVNNIYYLLRLFSQFLLLLAKAQHASL